MAAIIPFQHNFCPRTPTENKHARIVEIGWHQIQKPMRLSRVEKRTPQTLTNSENIVRKGRETARRSSRARSTRGLANEAWALYKSNPSRVSWVELSRDRYSLTKVSLPCWKYICSRAIVHLRQTRVSTLHVPECSSASKYGTFVRLFWHVSTLLTCSTEASK